MNTFWVPIIDFEFIDEETSLENLGKLTNIMQLVGFSTYMV